MNSLPDSHTVPRVRVTFIYIIRWTRLSSLVVINAINLTERLRVTDEKEQAVKVAAHACKVHS